ncbi:condensation domain-containing protein [Chitinophaga vietnamensis]|uniref:condensation domain-containing protein n=1 Tax=Chitinophaga vietnamensis TaxID=2593957 RepID=UPI001178B984|nr:condensation domain-containing protein [Chitinophaga vietnamensis]
MKDIAIIGMAGRFPEAANIAALRRNLLAGKDSVRTLSATRKSATTVPPGKTWMEFGFMENVDLFDHKFFHISKAEAEYMDPHQRLLLEVVYETIESAGYDMDDFNGSETAVFIGDTEQEYSRLAERFDPTLLTGNTNATTAGRVSRCFNFRGAAAMIDTACSSSLLAVHMACQELQAGDADYALAGGVRLILFPGEKNDGPDLGIMSRDGKTRSFSAKAEGTGAGEAIGCVLLKPLDKALADNDIIYAVIKGSAANQDAQLSGSLTAPSSQAQSEVIRKAWKKAGIDPATITYIEAHGSGTKLGDPIEISGIDLAFKGIASEKHFCAVSAIKSNIGHTGSAAGISGLIKTVLSLQHKELYPSIHFDEPNPFIDFKNSVTYINAAYKAWEAPFPRRAGISSFGLSGTNCHVVLEEAPATAKQLVDNGNYLFNFSAKTANSLRTYLQQFAAGIPENASLADISYTLTNGRKHYQHRVSLIADSMATLFKEIDNAHAQTTKEIPGKVILLFSGDAIVSDERLRQLLTPELKKYADACAAYYHTATPAINRFVLQYAMYHFAVERGLTTEHLLGTGTGDLVVAVALNEMTLEEALAQCVDEPEDTEGLSQRLSALLERESADTRVLFMEMGPEGCLSQGLRQLHFPDKDLLCHISSIEASPLEIFQTLYQQQYPMDWKRFGATIPGRRTPLPTYAFEPVRCWLREPLPLETEEVNHTTAATNGNEHTEIVLQPVLHNNWTDTEKKVAAIWTAVLKLDELSLDDDFFRLGGHSLMATKVISIIEKEFGIKLVFKDIFTFATVRALAKGVDELLAKGGRQVTYKAIRPAAKQDWYPISEAQMRLWLIEQANENMTAYNLPSVLLLESAPDFDKLEAAFHTLCQRHESLRTSFHERNAEPVQIVHDEVAFTIDYMQGYETAEAVLKTFLRAFDLTKAPLLRAALAPLPNGNHLLLFDMHHIISDGVSLGVFIAELIALYHGETLPPLELQFKDVIVWQQEQFNNGALQQLHDFWARQLSGPLPVLRLPVDKPRPAIQSFSGNKIVFDIPAARAAEIRALAVQTGTTPFMVLLAVYNVLLHKYSGQEDILVGSPVAGRSHADLDHVVGMFVNTLVLRNQPSRKKTFIQFLQEVKENSLNAFEHQDYPFATLVENLDLKKDPSRNPLFDVIFVLQNIEIPELDFDGIPVLPCALHTGTAQFDLVMEVNELADSHWPVKIEYSTALFEEETILLMKERFLALLQDVISDPSRSIHELSFHLAGEAVQAPEGLDFAFNF